MDNVFSFILYTIRGYVDVVSQFEFTAYGYTVNIYDFMIGLLILANLLPIFFVTRSYRSGSRSSERNKED